MTPVHPGRILKRELKACGLSGSALAAALRVPTSRIHGIVAGRGGISAETALRLARYFGTSAAFWLNLQSRYELAVAEQALGRRIAAEVRTAA